MSSRASRQVSGPGDVIPLCVPEIRGNEWKYVKECLDTNWVSYGGSFVDRFERVVADYVGTKYAIAVVNGTAALHISLLIAGVQPDDEVLLSTLSFIAPANAVRYTSAWPVFIDAEQNHWQMDAAKVEEFLTRGCQFKNGKLWNRKTGRRVRAIIPVHILGHPVNMDPITELARKYDLVVVEDATESLGAKYCGRMVGHLGDIACFSFNGNKIITTGGGGMIVTDNEGWAKKAKYLTTQAKDDPVEYVHKEVGYNYRLTNLQAAMGVAQMEHLTAYVDSKRKIAAHYGAAFERVPGLTVMSEASWAYSSFWLYTILVDQAAYGLDSRELLRRLATVGIQTRPLWQPLHRSAAHKGCPKCGGAIASKLVNMSLSLPCSVGISDADIDRVISSIENLRK